MASPEYDYLVIGAGVAGLWLAKRLNDEGLKVIVLEKARGSGGRLSSKRLMAEAGSDPVHIGIDLGCNDFEIQDLALKAKFEQAAGASILEHGQKLMGQPRNSALTRSLLGDVEARFASRVLSITKTEESWDVEIEAGEELGHIQAGSVLISAPPKQAADLLPSSGLCAELADLKTKLSGLEMLPQWVAVLVIDGATDSVAEHTDWQQTLLSDDDISVVSLENRKPNRNYPEGVEAIVIHASPEWSAARIDEDRQSILSAMRDKLANARGGQLHSVAEHIHRWLYSLPPKAGQCQAVCSGENSYFGEGLGLCGDYWGPDELQGVERALVSAEDLAEKILAAPKSISES